MAAPRAVGPGQMDRNGAVTPPDRLVSTFDFRTYSNATLASSGPVVAVNAAVDNTVTLKDTRLEVKEWEGRVVFSESSPRAAGPAVPSIDPATASSQTPPRQTTRTDSHGTSSSPISVSSSSSPEPDLPRPRIRAKYSPLASTAYTPTRPVEQPKAVHPFFQRDFRRARSTPPPPPAVNRPRMVAHYSSTSVTESSYSQSSQDSWRVDRRTEVELVSERIDSRRYSSGSTSSRGDEAQEQVENRMGSYRMDEVDAMLRDLDLNPTGARVGGSSRPKSTGTVNRSLPTDRAGATTMTAPVKKSSTKRAVESKARDSTSSSSVKIRSATLPTLPNASDVQPLPFFSFKDLASPPKVVYTRDVNEANDLLECMTGNVVGFDLEWPTKMYNQTTRRYDWTPGKTALMQIGDERLVVLMHVWHMPQLPVKAVEMLMDKSIYKLGVQIRGDEAKLSRDYPDLFPNGIESTVDLSHVARRADPIGTGPGNTLIALGTLARTYLRKELDKGDVRRSDWSKKLDAEQVEYAANDIASSVEIYKALLKVARSNNINIDLENITGGRAVLAEFASRADDDGDAGKLARAPPGVSPREWNALNIFKGGLTLREAAAALKIKETTVQSYVAGALSVLPDDSMTTEQKTRFLDEVPRASYVYKQHPKVFRRLREATAQAGSDTETERMT